jgi:hypothetical protein
MKPGQTTRGLVAALALLALGSCDSARAPQVASAPGPTATSNTRSAEAAPPTAEPRRIIRTAELSLEAASPADVQAKAAALAQAKGGFVLSADTSHVQLEGGAEETSVDMVIRVPVTAFDSTLEGLRTLGTRVANEKVRGEDVTEEYVDLEARLHAQRAVEQQYLEILKQAHAIHDVLEVQEKLGNVRTEIERAEGRRRYLEDRTNLATITLHIAGHIEALEASGPGFGNSVRRAGHDAVAVTIGLVNGAIRLVGVLVPVVILVLLPAYWLLRWLVRRRKKAASAVETRKQG